MSIGPTIEEVCSQIVDCEHKTAPIDPNGEYFAVGTPAMRGNAINYAESRKISRDTFHLWTRRMVPRPGDLLFAREAPVGPLVLIPDTGNVAPGQRTMLLRPDAEKIDGTFLFYLLTSPRQQELLLSKATGSTVAHLNVADVRSFVLPELPLLAEQRAIAEVLGALDDKIAANAKLIETLDLLARALTKRAIEPGVWQPLSTIALITMGSSPAGTSFNEAHSGVVFYQGVRDFGVRFPANRVWTTSPSRFAKTGDTLLSVRAPVGRANLAKEETCIGRGLASVRSRFERPFTLFHQLKDIPEAWAPFEAEGTVFGSINRNQLESLAVPVIQSKVEVELEIRLESIEGSISGALDENITLVTTRDALLPQLMSGKLRVKEAEMLVEELV
ncbi:restriction endonuclease subunit S [Arthrobacter sp. Sr33]